MAIIDRIKEINLLDGHYVVVGSGVMDALGLREAHDIDLVVSPAYFKELRANPDFTVEQKYGEEMLVRDDVEVWQGWGGPNDQPNFVDLYDNGVTIGDIRFANPTFVRDWKVAKARPKDAADVVLLNEYLQS